MGLWEAWCPKPLPRWTPTFLARFSSLNPLNINGYFPKHLESFIPSIYTRFKPKLHPETWIKSQETSITRPIRIQTNFIKNSKDLLSNQTYFAELNHDWRMGELTNAMWSHIPCSDHPRRIHKLILTILTNFERSSPFSSSFLFSQNPNSFFMKREMNQIRLDPILISKNEIN